MKVVSMDSGRRVAQGNLAYVQAKLGRTKDSAEHYCQYMKLFSSIEQGKATLMKLGNDPDPRVRLAIGAAFAHCAK
jgi:hypothetical protein